MGNVSHALVFSDVCSHLHVIIIGIASFHRSYCAVEFRVVLVNEMESVVASAHESDVVSRIFSCSIFVPVVKIDEVGINAESFVPTFLKVYAVALGVVNNPACAFHILRYGHVVFVELRFASLSCPAFSHHRGGMLRGSNGIFLIFSFMTGHEVFCPVGAECVHLISERPVVFCSDIFAAVPFCISPPHVAKSEEIFYIVGIVGEIFRCVQRVSVMGIVGIGCGVGIIEIVAQFMPRAVGIIDWCGVIKQQRFAIPVEPQILILSFGIEKVVNFLHHVYCLAVEAPETYLRHFVSFGFHVGEHFAQGFPFIPIPHGVSNIENKNIHSRIGKHGHVAANDKRVGREEISHFGFAPMVGVVILRLPRGIVFIFACVGVVFQNLGNVCAVGRVHVIEVGSVPRYIENTHCVLFAVFIVAHVRVAGHHAPRAVGGNPCVGIYVPRGRFGNVGLTRNKE